MYLPRKSFAPSLVSPLSCPPSMPRYFPAPNSHCTHVTNAWADSCRFCPVPSVLGCEPIWTRAPPILSILTAHSERIIAAANATAAAITAAGWNDFQIRYISDFQIRSPSDSKLSRKPTASHNVGIGLAQLGLLNGAAALHLTPPPPAPFPPPVSPPD